MIGIVEKAVIGVLSTGVLGIGALALYRQIEPKNLGEKLSWEGLTLLSTSSKDENNEEWKRLVKLYEDSNNQQKIGNFSLTAPNEEDQKRSSNIDLLKKECQKLFETKLDSNQLTQNESLAKNWCVKDAPGKLTNS